MVAHGGIKMKRKNRMRERGRHRYYYNDFKQPRHDGNFDNDLAL